jgi:predicted nucleic acid-binding protein
LEVWAKQDLEQWFEERVLSITKAIAERWGVVAAKALNRGAPLPIVDGLIAATAIEHGLTLATRNVKDFESLGATIFNPWAT